MFLSVFLPYVESLLRGTGAIGVMPACILWNDVYNKVK
jgi:hypothetical protein